MFRHRLGKGRVLREKRMLQGRRSDMYRGPEAIETLGKHPGPHLMASFMPERLSILSEI